MNFLTTATLLTLLIPIGQFIWSLPGERQNLGAAIARFGITVGAGVVAFLVLGAAVIHGDGDHLLAIEQGRLFARGFDGASLHYLTLVTIACGMIASTVRSAGNSALLIAAIILGGAAVPAAMKWVWFGPLMRAGVLDVAGAAPVHALPGACAIVLARMMRSGEDISRSAMTSARPVVLVGPIFILVGWIAYVLSAGVMHSPTTAWDGAYNALRAAVAAAVVAMAIARWWGDADPAIAVVGAIVTALAMVTSAAGRMPAALAFAVGASAAVLAPLFRVATRRWFGVHDAGALMSAHAWGGFFAMQIATPFAMPAESMRLQLAMQTITALMAAGAGVFVGLLSGLLGSIRLRYREPAAIAR